jgi:hypothetical protein
MKVTMTVTYHLKNGDILSQEVIEQGFKAALSRVDVDEINAAANCVPASGWLSSADAARALGLSERTLRLRAEHGEILRRRNGKSVLYHVPVTAGSEPSSMATWLPGDEAADALGISLRTLQRYAEAGQIERRKTGKETRYLLTPEVAYLCGANSAMRQPELRTAARSMPTSKEIKSGVLAALNRYGKLDGTCIIVFWLIVGRMAQGAEELAGVRAVLEGMNSSGEARFTVFERGPAPEMWEVVA